MRHQPYRASTMRRREAGFSLIELMISLVIGFVVVGAVFAAYLSTGSSGRTGRALSQVTEDASIALNVLRSGVNMVGYGKPTGFDTLTNRFIKDYKDPGLFGCDDAFTDLGQTIDKLACAKGDGHDSIAVAYEADQWNSVTSGAGSVVPLNCWGAEMQNVVVGGNSYYLNYSRFYLDGNQLMCKGLTAKGETDPQPLVDNVVDLQIKYGVAVRDNAKPDTFGVAYYSDAVDMSALPSAADWQNTVSVRICVVVKSAESALAAATNYQGCKGEEVKVDDTDLHLYRAFTTTVVLQNRLGAVL
jgi:type IV pilus assembly protein PilW